MITQQGSRNNYAAWVGSAAVVQAGGHPASCAHAHAGGQAFVRVCLFCCVGEGSTASAGASQ